MTGVMPEVAQSRDGERTDIRPFHVQVPEAKLTELRRRISATRWPERGTVADASRGTTSCASFPSALSSS